MTGPEAGAEGVEPTTIEMSLDIGGFNPLRDEIFEAWMTNDIDMLAPKDFEERLTGTLGAAQAVLELCEQDATPTVQSPWVRYGSRVMGYVELSIMGSREGLKWFEVYKRPANGMNSEGKVLIALGEGSPNSDHVVGERKGQHIGHQGFNFTDEVLADLAQALSPDEESSVDTSVDDL